MDSGYFERFDSPAWDTFVAEVFRKEGPDELWISVLDDGSPSRAHERKEVMNIVHGESGIAVSMTIQQQRRTGRTDARRRSPSLLDGRCRLW